MKNGCQIFLLALLFVACDNVKVGTELDYLNSRIDELKAENDSLHFELSSLKMYVDHLEEDNAEFVEELNRIPVNEE